MSSPDGRLVDSGETIDTAPSRSLTMTWRNELKPDLRAEGFSVLELTLEGQGDMVWLNLVQTIELPQSKLIADVAGGWPLILSSLKSLLEKGRPLEATRNWPEGL